MCVKKERMFQDKVDETNRGRNKQSYFLILITSFEFNGILAIAEAT